MNKNKILALAADLLKQSSVMFARRTCNDWKYPEHWTGEERGTFYRQYLLWCHNGDEEKVDKEMSETRFNVEYGPPDWGVASMIADILEQAAKKNDLAKAADQERLNCDLQ